MTPEQRTAIYGLTSALAPLLVALGLIVDETLPLVLAAVDGFLGAVVAFWHRPTKT